MRHLCKTIKTYFILILLLFICTKSSYSQCDTTQFIVNGGFENGGIAPSAFDGALSHAITSNASLVWQSCTGVPQEGSQFMVIDGFSNFTTNRIWFQTINNLIPGTQYTFSFWGLDIHYAYPTLPRLVVNISGVTLPNPITPDLTNVWQRFSYTFFAPSSSVTFEVRQDVFMFAGNDFGLDNFRLICGCEDCHTVSNECAITLPVADQACYWSTGGNSLLSVDGHSNFIGTAATNNTPFRIFTNGAERIHINQDVAPRNGFIGIGTTNPQNLVEINTAANPANGQTGLSGLRFTDLRSTHASSASNGKVLSVNSSGDVIMVNDVSGNGPALCTSYNGGIGNPTNYLPKYSSVQGFCNSLIWENSFGDNKVGIGTISPTAKLDIFSSDPGTTKSTGININVYGSTTTGNPWGNGSFGIDGNVSNNNAGEGVTGNYFKVYSPESGYGFGARYLVSTTEKAGTTNYGVYSVVEKAATNVGYLANVYTNMIDAENNYGFKSKIANATISNTGVFSEVHGSSLENIGSDFEVTDGIENNFGVRCSVLATGSSNYGVYGRIDASDVPCAFNAAIYGEMYPPDNACGSGPDNNWAGYFDGKVNVTGDLNISGNVNILGSGTIPGGLWQSSDRKLKENIIPLSKSLEQLLKLKCYTYNYNQTDFEKLGLPQGQRFGVLAQELQTIFPSLVKESIIPASYDPKTKEISSDQLSILTVNYTELIPVIIAGMQEQDKRIINQEKNIQELTQLKTELLSEIEALKASINACCVNLNKSEELNDSKSMDVPVLEQNNPNPFMESTSINFYIPTHVKNASISIYNINGSELRSVNISSRGIGAITFNGGELAAGTYAYTLFVDGKQVDSKWMMLTK
jgi:hypothetical protein